MFNLIWISKIWYMLEYGFSSIHIFLYKDTLSEKGPYSEFFWSVFSTNAGKYGPEKLRIRKLFTQLQCLRFCLYTGKYGSQKFEFWYNLCSEWKRLRSINLLQPSHKIELKKELIREITRLILENPYIVFWRKKR